jgi:hypothetical protein
MVKLSNFYLDLSVVSENSLEDEIQNALNDQLL